MSEAPADTATTPTESPQTPPEGTEPPATGDAADLAAEVEKWQKLARKHEDRAKGNADAAKELERIKREALPEQERLVAEAEARGTAAATAKLAGRIVDAEIKAAAAGRTVDVDALLEGLDRTKFLTDDGEPNTAAISAWVDRIAPKPAEAETAATPWPDLGQGATGSVAALNSTQLERDLKSALGIG